MPSSSVSRRSGLFEIRMSPRASVRQIPSRVASMSADWSDATARCEASLRRRRRPTSAVPSASTMSEPLRTPTCASLNVTPSAFTATSQRVTASATPTAPAIAPASNPINATQGASAITPSVADQENASIRPQVAAIAATARNVTEWRRSSMTAPRSLRSTGLRLALGAPAESVDEDEARRQEGEEDRRAKVLQDDDRVRDPEGLRTHDVSRPGPPDVGLRAVVALDHEPASAVAADDPVDHLGAGHRVTLRHAVRDHLSDVIARVAANKDEVARVIPRFHALPRDEHVRRAAAERCRPQEVRPEEAGEGDQRDPRRSPGHLEFRLISHS